MLWQPLTPITLASIVLPMFPIYVVIIFFFRKVHDYLDGRDSGMVRSRFARERNIEFRNTHLENIILNYFQTLQAATKRGHKRLIKVFHVLRLLLLYQYTHRPLPSKLPFLSSSSFRQSPSISPTTWSSSISPLLSELL